MRLLSIVGARPQFVKAAVLARACAAAKIEHRIVHTGQHYDYGMSDVFFEELGIPAPDHHLDVGSGSHGAQTGEMLKRLEPVLSSEAPDWVLLYGDTNSTLAGAVVASKLGQRVAHIESGLRSFNRRMPEELNRIVADHLSDLLFCPTEASMDNLSREGLVERAILSGDVMYDAFLNDIARAEEQAGNFGEHWKAGEFVLATVHRAENTNSPARLISIMNALEQISAELCPVVCPIHPRTRKALCELHWRPQRLLFLEPVSYLQMLLLEKRARFILTDSGGVQKEAYFAGVPCITLRDETEWIETLAGNCNILCGADQDRILNAVRQRVNSGPWQNLYGNGDAGELILEALLVRN